MHLVPAEDLANRLPNVDAKDVVTYGKSYRNWGYGRTAGQRGVAVFDVTKGSHRKQHHLFHLFPRGGRPEQVTLQANYLSMVLCVKELVRDFHDTDPFELAKELYHRSSRP